MDISNREYIHGDPSSTQPNLLPSWLSKPTTSPSVTLTLSPSTIPPPPPQPPSSTTTAIQWLQSSERRPLFPDPSFASSSSYPCYGIETRENGYLVSEVMQCCNELEEKQRAWAAHKKESAWRLKRVELQLESEKACKEREKMEETEAKIKALRQEQQAIMDGIEAEYREQISGLRRDAEIKEHKLAEQWASKHRRLIEFVHQMGCQPRSHDLN